MVTSVALGISLALLGIGVLGMVFAGIRSMFNGKSDLKRVFIMLIPVLIFVITYFTMGGAAQAGVATMGVLIALMVLSIIISGTRGTFKF